MPRVFFLLIYVTALLIIRNLDIQYKFLTFISFYSVLKSDIDSFLDRCNILNGLRSDLLGPLPEGTD